MTSLAENSKYFPTPLQEFQFYDKYSRFRYDLGRRETWPETVDRAVDYLKKLSHYKLDTTVYNRIKRNILELKVMPSMRLMAMAGEAADRTNVSVYNCSFMGIDSIECFAEALYISMSGCGVGFSVEMKYIEQLPKLPTKFIDTDIVHVIDDSTEGWFEAIHYHMIHLYDGVVTKFDYSKLRPAGSILKTKGGRASGPQPLMDAIDFTTKIFKEAVSQEQTKLKPIQVHDIMCAIGQCAVAGGTRRTAMISLFDKDDDEMLNAKTGNYNNYRWNANNSIVWDDDFSYSDYTKVMNNLFEKHNGEPGFWSSYSLSNTAPSRRNTKLIKGVNPCGEINLRNRQFCNLSSAICREDDTLETLTKKVELATIIGTIQSMATFFPLLRKEWKANCEEERLLGVDLNGQMDCPLLNRNPAIRDYLKTVAIATNKQYARLLEINPSTAITCVKPNGNSSQLLDCASGMHPRYSKYYIRNVRVGVHTPVYKVLFMSGVPLVPENGQDWSNITTAVASFPVKSPDNAVTRDDLNAISLLEYWKSNKVYYTEHNPSVTVYYKPEEQEDVRNWIWLNRDIVGGITLLPYSDAKFDNMPYVEINEETYYKELAKFPKRIQWELLETYEREDQTTAAQEVACVSGQCSL